MIRQVSVLEKHRCFFLLNSQPWQPRTNPTTSNLEGSSTAPPYFWVLKWVPPTSSKVNFFKEFSPSIWRKLPTSFFRQEFLIFPRYRGGHFFGCSNIKDRGWKNIFDSAIRIAIKMGRSPVKSWGFPVKGRILGPESQSILGGSLSLLLWNGGSLVGKPLGNAWLFGGNWSFSWKLGAFHTLRI